MNRVKELRKLHNVSQEELSKKLSVTEKTISRLENEKTQIKPDKAQKLADYFNVSEAYLLGYSDDNQQLDWNSVVEYLSELSDFDYKKMIEVVDSDREREE